MQATKRLFYCLIKITAGCFVFSPKLQYPLTGFETQKKKRKKVSAVHPGQVSCAVIKLVSSLTVC